MDGKVSSEIFLICDGQEQTRKDICASALDTLYYKESKVQSITRVAGCPPRSLSLSISSTGKVPLAFTKSSRQLLLLFLLSLYYCCWYCCCIIIRMCSLYRTCSLSVVIVLVSLYQHSRCPCYFSQEWHAAFSCFSLLTHTIPVLQSL